ncbi:HD family phosphohydrolase [Paenibacillus baekrokdamisoli]|uniref:HD family phosphohydrolase n=1 Tax=Paenibacillus baekrokdamisoli TaxID=1712516 RepID=A0A3G9J1Y5_9BACL|nr:HD-GYP domain-containing protein [Paenibacillus baekrokdamisoli]MBB3072552.1 HD-GYP domain-containing protein (c-di-GMP phosphodiesterase class II) [Paenibacillus baekrokdamisoli]BBH22395.1 HD family phosphohydrolase [Paenibacillus baekrokdamisoli]
MDSFFGRKVKSDITNLNGLSLIPAHTTLYQEHLTLLKNHSIDLYSIVFVSEDEDGYEQSIKQVVNTSKELFQSIRTSGKIPLLDIQKNILPAVQQASEQANVFQLFEAVKATDEYTYQHNIGVGILSTLIGRWLHLTESEIAILSLAATLHDIGKVKVPIEILNKPGKLTDDEFALIKKHTVYGYELLKDTIGIDQRIPLVALQHHERNDGKGYPLGLKEGKIEFFSRIVAVADIFHAMSSKRPYHDPLPFHEIVGQMRRGIFGELDPSIVSVFLANIVKRMVGENVVLTDGRVGEVVSLNPHNIETPFIKVNEEFIDLSKRNDIQIKEIRID